MSSSSSSSSSNHVRYILLAEFDIDRGSSLAHQYPEPTGADENFLAEQMLPDGAHLREEDWTVFFLNRKQKQQQQQQQQSGTSEGTKNRDSVSMPDQPLLYVLNLVRTKHDSQARRGAVVKAMAICVTFPAVDIFKAILLLAMEKYFLAPSIEVLELLFRTVNSLDLGNMPQFSLAEKRILRAWDIPDLFEEKFIAAASTDKKTRAEGVTNPSTASSLDQIDEGVETKRNTAYIDLATGRTSGSAVSDTGLAITGARKDRYFYETIIAYDAINIPIRVPLTNYTEEVGDFSLIKLISTFSPTSPSQTISPPFHAHLTTAGAHTHPIILLMNALLTQKRILFLGHERPAGEVANFVLAACAMGSGGGGVLRGFTDRAFPYANLAHLDDLLDCPGYIAGVTNPAFKDHPEWWDVLCDVKTGKITISSKIAAPDISETTGRDNEKGSSNNNNNDDDGGSGNSGGGGVAGIGRSTGRDTFDTEFIQEVTSAIQSHYSEIVIRTKFHDYVQRFVRLAALYEMNLFNHSSIEYSVQNTPDISGLLGYGMYFPDETVKKRELRLNKARIEGWRQTNAYHYYVEDFQQHLHTRSISALDIQRQTAKLRSSRLLTNDEIEAIIEAMLRSTCDDMQIIELLSYFPQNQGGLQPLATCLFHTSSIIREGIVMLLQQICMNPNGYRMVQCLNRYHRLAFDRLQTMETK